MLAVLMATMLTMAGPVTIQTKNISLVLNADNGKQPEYVYFGAKLPAADLNHVQRHAEGRMDAYPAYGMNTPAEVALAIKHADGNMSTQLEVTGTSTTSERGGSVTRIHLKDKVYPVTVDLCYKAYNDVDMIETWTEITTAMCGCLTSMARGPTKHDWWRNLFSQAKK